MSWKCHRATVFAFLVKANYIQVYYKKISNNYTLKLTQGINVCSKHVFSPFNKEGNRAKEENVILMNEKERSCSDSHSPIKAWVSQRQPTDMQWSPQVFTCAFPLHTLCVCVCVRECCLHEERVHGKVTLHWQLLSGRWSHFCRGLQCVCVCFYMYISSGRLLCCP